MNTHCKYVAPLLMLAIAASMLLPETTLAAWKIKEFEFVRGERNSLASIKEQMLTDGEDALLIEQLEDYMGQVARELEALGFREPVLEDITSDGKAYKIYFYDRNEPDGTPATYNPSCERNITPDYIWIDSTQIVKNGRVTAGAYATIAHELFHAVQYAYPLFRENCSIGNWITEGTAEAIGNNLAARITQKERAHLGTRLGARSYADPLRTPTDHPATRDRSYRTSSLWQYIAEHLSATARGGRAQSTPADRNAAIQNYGYLDQLFSRNLPGRPSEDAELQWLDEGLKQVTGLGLNRIYPNFVSTFAAYVPDRAGDGAFIDKWHERLFGECERIEINENQLTASMRLNLLKVAADCIALDIAIPDQVDVTFWVDNVSSDELRSLTLGTSGGAKVGKPTLVEPNSTNDNYFASWLFRVPTDEPQVFVISNVARDAEETQSQFPMLNLAVASWNSNMTEARPQKQPTKARPASSPTQRAPNPDQNAAQLAEEFKTGVDSLSSHVAGGVSVGRYPDERPCPDAFVDQPCGPSTSISLMLMPGSAFGLGYVSGSGGSLAQLMGTFTGIATAGPANLSGGYMEGVEDMAGTDGSEVKIVIPLIDYGFSGTFNNAFINVVGKERKGYVTVGPEDRIPGPGRAYALSGQVTIEEYTPHVMKGSFSGELVDVSTSEPLEGNDPTLPVYRSVSGSFHIVTPWKGDSRVSVVQEADDVAFQQDMNEAFPFLSGSSVASPEAVVSSRNSSSSSSSGGQPSCDCSCNRVMEEIPACGSVCSATFTACAGEKYEPKAEAVAAAQTEQTKTEVLRAHFARHLEQQYQGVEGAEIDHWLDIFDQQQTYGMKKVWLQTMGIALPKDH